MQTLIEVARGCAGFLAGGLIGLVFGALQQAALERHERQMQAGRSLRQWSLIPGAGARIAYLLIALVLVQALSPWLFSDPVRWLVSGGLLTGYGAMLTRQLQRRRRAGRGGEPRGVEIP